LYYLTSTLERDEHLQQKQEPLTEQ